MKINIPKVVIPVPMEAYAAELSGKFLYVWVNPPKNKLNEYDDLITSLQQRELEKARQTLLPDQNVPETSKGILARSFDQVATMLRLRKNESASSDSKLLEWYAEVWSCGPEDSRWTVDELREYEQLDPAFLSWMITQTWQTRTDHLTLKKKV